MSARGTDPAADAAADDDDAPGSTREERISRWEWIAGAVGLALVVAALVVLGREVAAPVSPVDLAVRVDSVRAGRHAHVVHFTLDNTGTAPAMDVTVEGELSVGGGRLVSMATIRYVPGESRRSGGLLFPADPKGGALRLRALGYEEP